MIRFVVAFIVGVAIVLYFLYFMEPLIVTSKSNFAPLLNMSDPTITTSYNLGNTFYIVLPWIPILVGGFIIFSVALRRSVAE